MATERPAKYRQEIQQVSHRVGVSTAEVVFCMTLSVAKTTSSRISQADCERIVVGVAEQS